MNGPRVICRVLAEFDVQGVENAAGAQRSNGEISSSAHARSSEAAHDGQLVPTMRRTCLAVVRMLAPLSWPGLPCGIKRAIAAPYSHSSSPLACRERHSSRFTRDT